MVEARVYDSKIWRENVRTQILNLEPVPPSWQRLGGRGLIARVLLDEVPPECEPLGMKNKLIFCNGLLTGHMLSSIDRLSVGGKSPLTGGIKESNSGGTTGLQIAYMGIKALIIEDLPVDDKLSVLVLTMDGVRFDQANEISGMGVYGSAEILALRGSGTWLRQAFSTLIKTGYHRVSMLAVDWVL
jgi:aldehyde:ferredoxin oxidoreductase